MRATVARALQHVRHQNETRHECILRDNHGKLDIAGACFGGDKIAAALLLRFEGVNCSTLRRALLPIRYGQSIALERLPLRHTHMLGTGLGCSNVHVSSEVFVNRSGNEPQDRQSFVTTPTEFGGTPIICNFERHGGERFPRNKSADRGLRQEERPYVPYM